MIRALAFSVLLFASTAYCQFPVWVPDTTNSDVRQLLNTTGATRVAAGTTAQRPGTPVVGQLRWNSTTSNMEAWDGDSWENLITAAFSGLTIGDSITGGGANQILFEDGSNNLASDANLTWDGSVLSLGGSAPKFNVPTDGIYRFSNNNTYGMKYTNLGGAQLILSSGGRVVFSPNGSEEMRVDTGGTGINETSPGAQLHVTASGAAVIGQITQGASGQTANLAEFQDSASTVLLAIDEQGYFERASGNFLFTASSGNLITRTSGNVSIQNLGGTPQITLQTDGGAIFNSDGAAVDFRVESDNNENMLFVDGSADAVGLGTTSPEDVLHLVVPSAGPGMVYLDAFSNNVWDDFILHGRKSHSGSVGTVAETEDSDDMVSLYGSGVNSSLAYATAGGIVIEQDGSSGATHVPGKITFYTSTNAATFANTSVFNAAGFWGVNETSPGAQLHVTVDSASTIGQIIRLASGVTADAFVIENAAGTDMVWVDETGKLAIANGALGGQAMDVYSVAAPVAVFQLQGATGDVINAVQGGTASGTVNGLKAALNTTGRGRIHVQNSQSGTTEFYGLAIGAGDIQTTYEVNGAASWSTGLDRTDDSFRISNSTTLGTTDVIHVTTTETTLKTKVSYDTQTELTIATGAVTVTKSYHSVDGEGDASDSLDTINGGTEGMRLIIRANHTDRTITVTESGNCKLAGGSFAMDNTEDTMELIYDGSNWLELSRSDNGA